MTFIKQHIVHIILALLIALTLYNTYSVMRVNTAITNVYAFFGNGEFEKAVLMILEKAVQQSQQ
jgi:hypothetical protein